MILQEDVQFLEHYGTKGMKWGVRNDTPTGATKKVNRDAKKDAKEFNEAKLFYGKSAGNRRKLIKATVEGKRKKDASYGKAFDHHVKNTDTAKGSDKAKTQRKRADRKERTGKQAGAAARRITGEQGTQAAFLAAAVGGAVYLNSPKGRALGDKMMNKASTTFNNAKTKQQMKKGGDFLTDYMKRNT